METFEFKPEHFENVELEDQASGSIFTYVPSELNRVALAKHCNGLLRRAGIKVIQEKPEDPADVLAYMVNMAHPAAIDICMGLGFYERARRSLLNRTKV